jgi:hypothetical protein
LGNPTLPGTVADPTGAVHGAAKSPDHFDALPTVIERCAGGGGPDVQVPVRGVWRRRLQLGKLRRPRRLPFLWVVPHRRRDQGSPRTAARFGGRSAWAAASNGTRRACPYRTIPQFAPNAPEPLTWGIRFICHELIPRSGRMSSRVESERCAAVQSGRSAGRTQSVTHGEDSPCRTFLVLAAASRTTRLRRRS